jgi:hypothetical protein
MSAVRDRSEAGLLQQRSFVLRPETPKAIGRTEKRVGRIDLGAQAEVASARRTDTPTHFSRAWQPAGSHGGRGECACGGQSQER